MTGKERRRFFGISIGPRFSQIECFERPAEPEKNAVELEAMNLNCIESTHAEAIFRQRSSALGAIAATILLVFWAPLLGSAEEQNLSSDIGRPMERGVHIVRQGETLREITSYYLGSDDLWQENLRLNPQLANPDLIYPGQRIMVLREPNQGVSNALLTQVAGRVEDRPMPHPWDEAQVRDLLLERDGIRTYEGSSTRMTFPDGTSVLLTEDSLVFLRKSGKLLTGAESKSVEIVEGQADIDAQLGTGSQAQVEILVGGALATLNLDDQGVGYTRAKKVEGVGDFVMMYEGDGEVEAAGEKVQVDRGMGTAVADNQPPSPPEALLLAPEPTMPSANSVLDYANPGFEWEPIEDAASYTLELCRDDLCGELILRETGLVASSWTAAQALPAEDLYWRVTATSATGLDGYPSVATPFSLVSARLGTTGASARLDTTPPRGELQVIGRSVWVEGKLVVDETVKLKTNFADSESGLAKQSPWVNGHPAGASFWGGPWQGGSFEAKVVASDRSGNVGETAPLLFTVDADPPVVDWRLDRQASPNRGSGRHGKWIAQGVKWLEWSVDGEKWKPMVWGDPDSPIRRYISRLDRKDLRPSQLVGFEVKSSRPQILFRAPGGEVFSDAEALSLRDDQVLRIFADDLPAGVSRLRVRIEDGESEKPVLVVEAIDFFGHKERVAWNLVSQNRKARDS